MKEKGEEKMTEIKDFVKLGLGALGMAPADYSVQECTEAFKGEIAENFGCKTIADFMRVKPDVFQILQEIADEYLPKRLNETLGKFAEIRQIEQGTKYEFKITKGKLRGKSFVTQVAPSGQYETFRLDKTSFTVPVKAYGGAAIMEWERFLNGDENLVELIQIIAEGIEDRIYEQIQGMLKGMLTDSRMPSANKYTDTKFDPTEMDKLIAVVRAYGSPAIWCTPEFASTMTNQVSFTSATPTISELDLADIRNQGFIGRYKGVPVIVMPQSFADEQNTIKVMDPQMAYIIPQGDENIVRIILEGYTQINEFENRDWSSEIQMYKKAGLAIVTNPNYWAIYQNTNIQ